MFEVPSCVGTRWNVVLPCCFPSCVGLTALLTRAPAKTCPTIDCAYSCDCIFIETLFLEGKNFVISPLKHQYLFNNLVRILRFDFQKK